MHQCDRIKGLLSLKGVHISKAARGTGKVESATRFSLSILCTNEDALAGRNTFELYDPFSLTDRAIGRFFCLSSSFFFFLFCFLREVGRLVFCLFLISPPPPPTPLFYAHCFKFQISMSSMSGHRKRTNTVLYHTFT